MTSRDDAPAAPVVPCPGGGIDDSHAHLDMPEFAADRDAVVARARAAGIGRIVCPADLTEPGSLETVLALAGRDPAVFAAAGVHPHNARKLEAGHLARLRSLAAAREIVAVGEIGLDFHYNLSPPDAQREAFRRQLGLAAELGLPAIVHSRETGGEVVAAISAAAPPAGGILHCYTGDRETAEGVIARGFYVSFSGILTFPRAGALREVARALPEERLLVETDSPYLAPVPRRGARCEPAFAVETARALAAARGTTLEALAPALRRNLSAALRV